MVDDRLEMRELLGDVLREAGAAVVVCASGIEALGAMRAGRFDALVSDLQMPAVNGLELLRRLRARQCDTPAIAVTGDPDPGLRDPFAAVLAGFDHHLLKPVEPTLLVDTVARLVRPMAR